MAKSHWAWTCLHVVVVPCYWSTNMWPSVCLTVTQWATWCWISLGHATVSMHHRMGMPKCLDTAMPAWCFAWLPLQVVATKALQWHSQYGLADSVALQLIYISKFYHWEMSTYVVWTFNMTWLDIIFVGVDWSGFLLCIPVRHSVDHKHTWLDGSDHKLYHCFDDQLFTLVASSSHDQNWSTWVWWRCSFWVNHNEYTFLIYSSKG